MNTIRQSEQLDEFAKALCAAQGDGLIAIEGDLNPKVNSKFANFVQIVTAIRAVLLKNGLSFTQDVGLVREVGGFHTIGLTTTVLHVSGQWRSSDAEFPIQVITVRETGKPLNITWASAATVTYLRRYCLCCALGIVTGGDDDAAKFAEQASVAPAASSLTNLPGPDADFTGWTGGLWREAYGPDGRKLGDYKAPELVNLVKECIDKGEEIEALKAWIFDRMDNRAKALGMAIVPALEERGWQGIPDFENWKLDDFRTAGMLLAGGKPQGDPQP